jgi:hypothetical protein
MPSDPVVALVKAFSCSKVLEISAACTRAESLGPDLLPLLVDAFPKIPAYKARSSILRYVGGFTRTSELAFGIGVMGTADRSWEVRHYGCAALAFPLTKGITDAPDDAQTSRSAHGRRRCSCHRRDSQWESQLLWGSESQRQGSVELRLTCGGGHNH